MDLHICWMYKCCHQTNTRRYSITLMSISTDFNRITANHVVQTAREYVMRIADCRHLFSALSESAWLS